MLLFLGQKAPEASRTEQATRPAVCGQQGKHTRAAEHSSTAAAIAAQSAAEAVRTAAMLLPCGWEAFLLLVM